MTECLGPARHHLRRHRCPLQRLLPRHLRLQRPRHLAERQLVHFRRQKCFRGERHFVDDVRRDVQRRRSGANVIKLITTVSYELL